MVPGDAGLWFPNLRQVMGGAWHPEFCQRFVGLFPTFVMRLRTIRISWQRRSHGTEQGCLCFPGISSNRATSSRDRAVNTALGGLVALLAYALWPTWERTQAGPVFADLIEDYRAYFNAFLKAYRGEGEGYLDKTRSKAWTCPLN